MATGDSLEDLEEILKAQEEEEGDGDDSFDEDSGDEEDSSEDEEGDDDGDEESEGEGESDVDAEEVDASDDDEDGDGDDEDDDEDGDEDVGEDDDDDEEQNDDEEENEKVNNDVQFEDSDSGGDDVESCPICLSRLRRQDIGTPESCDHNFCLECIQEWAKNVNTCPVDRQVFHLILARHPDKEKIFKQIPVVDKKQDDAEEEDDDPTHCEICGQSNHEDRLLLCDGCDHGYHCECLTPALTRVPVNAWFCPECAPSRIDAVVNEPRQLRRRIGRTLISDRVRRLIQDARAERADRRQRVTAMIDTQEDMETDPEEPGPSAEPSARATTARQRIPSQTRKKKKTTKRKTTKKRKTTRKRKTKKSSTKKKKKKTTRKKKATRKGKGKKRKKTTKRKSTSSSPAAARTVRLPPPSSVKGRIADRLGLSKPPVGRSIPMQKVPSGTGSTRDGPHRAVEAGPASLSILGNKDELYSFAESEGVERQIVNRPAIPAEQLLSRSALLSHSRISVTPPKRKVEVSKFPAGSSSSGLDLIGSIMMNQDMLAKGSRHVTINRDGSLSAKTSDTAISPSKRPSSDQTSTSTAQTSGSMGSLTSISDSPSCVENKQNKSPCSSKNPENDGGQSGPSPKKVCHNNNKDYRRDSSSQSDNAQIEVSHNDLDAGFNSDDDELVDFCLKTEAQDLQKEGGGNSDVEMNRETKPLLSGRGDSQEEMEWDGEIVGPASPISMQPSSPVSDSMTMEGVETTQNVVDNAEGGREEGEASDSNEEGEIRSDEEAEGSNRNDDGDEEEGEIIDEEEKPGNEITPSESKRDVSGKTDATIVNGENEKVGKASESDYKCIEIKLETQTSVEENHNESVSPNKEREEDDDDEYDPNDPMNGSFQVARFLHSLVTNEFDRKKEADQRREEEERKREEEERKKVDSQKGLSEHKISILDFIGNAGAMFGVAGDSQSSRMPGRGRGRGAGRPLNFGGRRGSKDEDSRGGRGRGKRENSFPAKRNGYDGGEELGLGEKAYLHERQMHPGPQTDYHERQSHSLRSDSSDRSSSQSRRNVEKRKRQEFVNNGMNGDFRRDRDMRRGEGRSKRRKLEGRNKRKVSKYCKRTSEESSESGSSSESNGESDDSSSSSDNSLIKLSEMPAMPTTPSDSPCPTPPSAPPPPPPLPPPIAGQDESPQPPPPPDSTPPHSYIPPSAGPPQHNLASGHHPSAYTHPSYSHLAKAHVSGQTQGVKYTPDSSYAPSSGQAPPGQPRPQPTTYPQAYHHPSQPHHAAPTNSQNPPTHPNPTSHPHPTPGAYPRSAYPSTGYPYYPQSHAYPSSYYPSASVPAGQQRPGAPGASSTHPSAATYHHYPSHHPSSGYPSTASTAVRHPQRFPAAYPSSHSQQTATSHPYYQAHSSTQRPPVPQSYAYPHRHPYPVSTTVGASTHPSHTQVSAPLHPQNSNSTTRSHSHPSTMVRAEPPAGIRPDAANYHAQRHFRTVKESTQKTSPKPEVKSARVSYRPSPPTVRGVATSDRVASIILHDEVKKGFRQLVEDAVRSALRPAWGTKKVSKEAYKDIFKKCVEKVCGSKETVVQQDKIQSLVDAYVAKARKARP